MNEGMTYANRVARFRDRGVGIHGNVELGDCDICGPGDINGTKSHVVIGDGCDIAAFVTINCADSSRRCVGLADDIDRGEIVIGERVFIGTGATIIGPCKIGDGVRIGAGVFLKGCTIGDRAVLLPGTVLLRREVEADSVIGPAAPVVYRGEVWRA